MPKVIVLPDHIASQIAAGEVVDRPAAVVKELVENAIDSGATQVEIAVASECRDIRVADNGSGMDPEDAVLAFQRHATSKLQTADDLSSLRTLGFRGEALPSIASVSKVTCYTRTTAANVGTRVDTENGKLTARETGCASGTVIEVTDLFYNVPARLSFLKKPTTEFGHMHEIVQSLSIAYPKITFQLLNQGEVVLRTSGSGKLAQVLQEVGILSGREELVDVTHADLGHGMAIYGYVARPPHSRGDRRGLLTIVNNRPVRCPVSYKALDYAFSDLIPKGKHPVGVITITIDPREVDVNIHPTKKEVRYRNSSAVFLAVEIALKEALRNSRQPIVDATASSEQSESAVFATISSGITAVREPTADGTKTPLAGNTHQTHRGLQQLSLRERLTYAPPQAMPLSSPISDPAAPSRQRLPVTLPSGWRLIGYLHNTYMLLQTADGLMVVEQHIAHERVIYERLLLQQKTPGRLAEHCQHLVISAPLNLSAEQRCGLVENVEALRSLGFDFDMQGNQVSCTRIPLELANKDYASSVQSNVESMLIAGAADFALEATKSVACQAAVKDGMPLSESEILELLDQWSKCPRNDTCPHGRPNRFELFHESALRNVPSGVKPKLLSKI